MQAKDDASTALMMTTSPIIGELLLNHNAEIDSQDITGKTALHHALRKDCFEYSKILLLHGSRFDIACDEEGETAEDLVKKKLRSIWVSKLSLPS